MCLFKTLTFNHILYLSAFADKNEMINQNSLFTAIARLVKSGVFANDKTIAYDKRSYVLYELKEPAFPLMVKGANRLLKAAGYESVDLNVLKEHYYSLNHNMKELHDVEVASVFLKIIFQTFTSPIRFP